MNAHNTQTNINPDVVPTHAAHHVDPKDAARARKEEDQKSHTKLTEAGYLQNQVNDASAAIGAAFAALKTDLAAGLSPNAIAKQYPWATVGAAAVAGFVAATAIIPSKEEQALKKLERIERALHPHLDPHPAAAAAAGAHAAPPQEKSLASRLFSELFSALKPALSSALAAYAAGPSDNGNGDGNGHTSSDAAAGNAAFYQQDEDHDQA